MTISLTGTSAATTATDVNGNYIFTGLNNGEYAVRPSKALCSFSPTDVGIIISGLDVIGQNFTAKCK